MRTPTGFHPDQAGLEIGEEAQDVLALELLAQHRFAPLIDSMDLKHVLCQIDPDSCNLHLGRSFLSMWIEPISTLAL
jgi:hypothetical protein